MYGPFRAARSSERSGNPSRRNLVGLNARLGGLGSGVSKTVPDRIGKPLQRKPHQYGHRGRHHIQPSFGPRARECEFVDERYRLIQAVRRECVPGHHHRQVVSRRRPAAQGGREGSTSRRWRRQHLAAAVGLHRTHHPGAFHFLHQPRRPVVADPKPTLHPGHRGPP